AHQRDQVLPPVRGSPTYLDFPGQDDIETVPGLPLGEEHVALADLDRLHLLGERFRRLRVHALEDPAASQYLVHRAPPTGAGPAPWQVYAQRRRKPGSARLATRGVARDRAGHDRQQTRLPTPAGPSSAGRPAAADRPPIAGPAVHFPGRALRSPVPPDACRVTPGLPVGCPARSTPGSRDQDQRLARGDGGP